MITAYSNLLEAVRKIQNPPLEIRTAIAEIERQDNDPRRSRIIALAQQEKATDGELEIDEDAVVSEGDGNGAYVQSWVWIDFMDTDLDKDNQED